MSTEVKKNHLNDERVVALDLLRFLAAVMVMLYHYTARHDDNNFPILSALTEYGYLGVPVFFAISGFVISMSANNRTAFQFGISRFTRIYPALWICLPITLLVSTYIGDGAYSIKQIATNLLLVNDYFSLADIDGVYWTLHAELKFYGCIFLLLLCGVYRNIMTWLIIWLLCTVLFQIFHQPFFMGWFISPHYSCYFIIGVILYQMRVSEKKNLLHILLLVTTVLCAYVSFHQVSGFIKHATIQKSYVASIFVISFILLFYAISENMIKIENRRWITLAGGITYPLYLTHNIVGVTIIDFSKSIIGEVVSVGLTIALMILISLLIHIWLEQPLTRRLRGPLYLLENRLFGK